MASFLYKSAVTCEFYNELLTVYIRNDMILEELRTELKEEENVYF